MEKSKTKEKTKDKKFNLSKKTIITLALVAVIFILAVCAAYSVATPPIKTQTAVDATYKDTVTAKMFAVREEKYITAQNSGVPVSIVKDGERVAKEQPIAAYLADEEKAKKYIELKNSENELLRFQNLVAQEHHMSTNIKISKVNSEADKAFSDAVEAVNSSDLRNINENFEVFNSRITTKQILLNGNIDFTKEVEKLQTDVETLKKEVGRIDYVSSHTTGYFSSFTDGYEGMVKPSQLQNLNCTDINNILNSKPLNVPTNNMGKVIVGYNWYFVGILSQKDALKLDLGRHIKIQCENVSRGYIDAVVESKGKAEKDGVPVVLKSNIMDSDISRLRIEDVQIVLNETDGLRVSNDAVRVVKIVKGIKEPEENKNKLGQDEDQEKQEPVEVVEILNSSDKIEEAEALKDVKITEIAEGVHGVYVRKRNTVKFRRLDVIYTSEDYIISKSDANDEPNELGVPYLDLYDEVIVDGKDLEDGKVIK